MPGAGTSIDTIDLVLALLAAVVLAVPFVPQQKDTCAAASLAMVLRYWGEETASPDAIARELLQPELNGILGSRLEAFAKSRGFTAVAYEGDADQLAEYVAKGRPLIVAWKLGRDRFHNVVVVGVEEDGDVLVNDPAVGAARRVDARTFEKRWKGAGHWTLLVMPAQS
jgi:ABC-type bacteriocin/lantibiotic exporter with double-glycine peptidase domain